MADFLPLDVIWIHDDLINPPGPKMVVCLEPELGLYFRINTDPHWQTPVFLKKEGVHEFLKHDSYLECGDPFEIDDYLFGDSRPIGAISADLIPLIVASIDQAKWLRSSDRAAIKIALGIG